jgi:hypothetical protein
MDQLDQTDGMMKSQYGVLKLQQSPLATDSGTSSSDNAAAAAVAATAVTGHYSPFSFSNPVYEPTAANAPGSGAAEGPTYKVEDVVIRMRSVYGSSQGKAWGGLKSKLPVVQIYSLLSGLFLYVFVSKFVFYSPIIITYMTFNLYHVEMGDLNPHAMGLPPEF